MARNYNVGIRVYRMNRRNFLTGIGVGPNFFNLYIARNGVTWVYVWRCDDAYSER